MRFAELEIGDRFYSTNMSGRRVLFERRPLEVARTDDGKPTFWNAVEVSDTAAQWCFAGMCEVEPAAAAS